MKRRARSRRHVIYALVDPRNSKVRYVGRTTNPVTRWKSFHSALRIFNIKRYEWIRALSARKLYPRMMLLETCRSEVVAERESFWICHYRRRGRIFNIHDHSRLQEKWSSFSSRRWFQ